MKEASFGVHPETGNLVYNLICLRYDSIIPTAFEGHMPVIVRRSCMRNGMLIYQFSSEKFFYMFQDFVVDEKLCAIQQTLLVI